MDSLTPIPIRACHVIAAPYPGRGHINPMMDLCKLLVSRNDNIFVTFVVTEEWHGLLGSQPKPPVIRFGCLPNVIPSEHGRAGDFPGFIRAVDTKMEEPFERLLDRLDQPPTVILADTYLSWTVRVGNRRNIPVASLWTQSATTLAVLYYFDLLREHGHFPADLSEVGEHRVSYIPGISSIRLLDLPTVYQGSGSKVINKTLSILKFLEKAQYLLFTSVQELEPHVLNAFRSELPIPIYPVGPIIPTIPTIEPETQNHPESKNNNRDNILLWLDSQPKASVLYVSLGSFLSVPDEQMNEIAAGLHDSGVRYLWVTRSETARFQENCSERGLAVAWCDQLKVLSHPSVGGFWTHCGWNSTMECAYAGLPMLTCPIFWDQAPNSKIIVEDWKIGVRLRKAAVGLGVVSSELVSREDIAKIVKGFMDSASEDGKEMRKRAREIGEISHRAIEKSGSSASNIDAFIENITKGR